MSRELPLSNGIREAKKAYQSRTSCIAAPLAWRSFGLDYEVFACRARCWRMSPEWHDAADPECLLSLRFRSWSRRAPVVAESDVNDPKWSYCTLGGKCPSAGLID